MLHLDTSTVVAYLRGDATVQTHFGQHADDLAISSIVLGELLFGASLSSQPTQNLAHVRTFRAAVDVVDFDERAAEKYAELRLSLRRRGLPTGEPDALIAAIALAHGATLVTHNLKHFENIEGLKLEDWVVSH